jgi:hypothetical protein
MQILEIASHRNGIGGEPFYAVRFREKRGGPVMLGVVFGGEWGEDDRFPTFKAGEPIRVAVFDAAMAAVTVAFTVNSWRGDVFADDLYAAITEWERRWPERHPARKQAEKVAG